MLTLTQNVCPGLKWHQARLSLTLLISLRQVQLGRCQLCLALTLSHAKGSFSAVQTMQQAPCYMSTQAYMCEEHTFKTPSQVLMISPAP